MRVKVNEQEIDKLIAKYRFEHSEHDFSRLPLERVVNMVDLVKAGNYQELLKLKKLSESRENLGTLAGNEKTNLIYYIVATITLATYSAIEGGLPPEEAFDLGDVLLQRLALMDNDEDIQEMFRFSLAVFAKKVFLSHRKTGQYAVEQAKTYISRHIFKPIQIKDIASYTGLTENYLGMLFKKKRALPFISTSREKR